jgi:DNA recombination protein RmuC
MNAIDLILIGLAGAAALFALLAFLRSGKARSGSEITPQQLSQLLRDESDRMRQWADEQNRATRQELTDNLRGFQETTLKVFRELSDVLGAEVKEFGDRLDRGIKAIDERAAAIGTKLDRDIASIDEEAKRGRESLKESIEGKLENAGSRQATSARELREEMTSSFQSMGKSVADSVGQLGDHQKERLDQVTNAVSALSDKHERAQDALKRTVEERLDAIRSENAAKLDEMRKTVDEKLQATLETRLGESFGRVVEQLERVYKGIGEMQTLAVGVGDLKRVLSNVRIRGTFGEVQLGRLLEQFLSADQYVKNVQVRADSQDRVEYAVKLPGRDSEGEVLLPIDAKFPQEDYERLITASELGDAQGVNAAAESLENRIKLFAKTIQEKYLAPPRTTDFAILFLPTEGLYAEVLRRPGILEHLQQVHHVAITGPSTLTAFLNALQMGFHSIAIGKQSSEIWRTLDAVRSEFGKYNKVVETLSKQLGTAARSVDDLGIRTRAIDRKLRVLQKPPDAPRGLLGPSLTETEESGETEDPSPDT